MAIPVCRSLASLAFCFLVMVCSCASASMATDGAKSQPSSPTTQPPAIAEKLQRDINQHQHIQALIRQLAEIKQPHPGVSPELAQKDLPLCLGLNSCRSDS